MDNIQNLGVFEAYLTNPVDFQRSYVEVSLMELAAYELWRCCAQTDNPTAWGSLEPDIKAEYVPDDPRAFLAKDGKWTALLVDAPVGQHNVADVRLRQVPKGSLSSSGSPLTTL